MADAKKWMPFSSEHRSTSQRIDHPIPSHPISLSISRWSSDQHSSFVARQGQASVWSLSSPAIFIGVVCTDRISEEPRVDSLWDHMYKTPWTNVWDSQSGLSAVLLVHNLPTKFARLLGEEKTTIHTFLASHFMDVLNILGLGLFSGLGHLPAPYFTHKRYSTRMVATTQYMLYIINYILVFTSNPDRTVVPLKYGMNLNTFVLTLFWCEEVSACMPGWELW